MFKLESPEQDLEHVTLAGESDTLEFKRELPQKREDIAVVAVSFANSRGGRILVGIDDNGQVVGCNLEKPEEQLASILRHYCEPPLSFGVTETMLREKRVISVTITEGTDKPYLVRDKGVYVRSGSTSRIATRYELDEMYRH